MRLTTVILIASLMQVSATTLAQRINMSQKNAKLESVLREIRKQSGYDFFYDARLTQNQKVDNVSLNNATIDDALIAVFKNLPLTFEIEGKTVSITKKQGGFFENLVNRFQSIDIHGRVVDENTQVMSGVTIRVKDGRGSSLSDEKGGFNLKNIDENATLEISYIGYNTIEIKATADLTLIRMEPSSSKLDEIQIEAYGTTSRRISTSSISTIKAEDIAKQPVNNPLLALQGRIPGLEITPSTGLSGGAINIQIRGKNSLDFSAPPLVVIDGLPVMNNITGLNYSSLSQLSSLSFVSPNDIESIDVLKDADATSIYGSRGANGVILITTKKGKIGQTRVDVNVQTGWSDVPKKIDMLNTQQFTGIRKQAYTNSNIDFVTTFPFDNEAFKYFLAPDFFVWDQNRYTDWQEELIGKTALYRNAQASVSGGTALVQYILGGTYHKETTVFPGDDFDQKGNAHFSFTGASPNLRFKATLTGSYQYDKNTLPGVDLTGQAIKLAPNAPSTLSPDGSLNWAVIPLFGVSSWDNPYIQLRQPYSSIVNNLTTGANFGYQILPSLKVSAVLGYNRLNGNGTRLLNTFSDRRPQDLNSLGSANFTETEMTNSSIEPQLSFKTIIGKGLFSALVGSSIQTTNTKSEDLFAGGYTSDALMTSLSAASSLSGSNNSSQYKYFAVFSRLNYNLNNKYIVNINVRRDGSSRFGPDNLYGNFGSIGAAWVFTEENSIKQFAPFLSFGKVRVSYGTSGNDGIGDYQYLERYNPVSAAQSNQYQGTVGYRSEGLFNSYYAWEVTKKLELAIETGFLKDRILLNGNYFRNRSDNQLIGYPYPTMAGPGRVISNLPALIQNSGFEVSLSTVNLKSDNFTWTTSFNITRNRNKLISFPTLLQSVYGRDREVGQPFTGFEFVYNYAGVDTQTGRYQFKDKNGNLTYNPEDPADALNGRYVPVMTSPKYYGGLSNSFTYKGFNLDILFQFVKQNGISPFKDFTTNPGYSASNLPVEFLSNWKTQNDVTRFQKLSGVLDNDLSQASNYYALSTASYTDASFIRLKNLAISYTIPGLWKQKLHLQNLRLFLQGQNLLTITKYEGLDPETQSLGTLPSLRIVTVGFQVSF